jgi:hypothetical protein
LRGEAAADPRFGRDIAGSGGIGFEPAPQFADRHPQIVGSVAALRTPDRAQDLLMSNHLARTCGKDVQHLVSLDRQMDL